MQKSKTFQELILWQKAHQLILDIYKITQDGVGILLYLYKKAILNADSYIPNSTK